jgi:hypothetical protein
MMVIFIMKSATLPNADEAIDMRPLGKTAGFGKLANGIKIDRDVNSLPLSKCRKTDAERFSRIAVRDTIYIAILANIDKTTPRLR